MMFRTRLFVAGLCVVGTAARGAVGQLAARVSGGPYSAPEAAAPALPLASNGYCTVTLRDRQQWRRGNLSIAAQFDGRQYVFAGVRERDIFAAAPITYTPVLGGDCCVTFAETSRRVPGASQYGVLHGGRIYFFAGGAERTKFLAAPVRYADADFADGGRCIVTRVEQQRDVAGLPETAVLSGGMRRLFAGAYEQSLYLQHPERYDAASATPPPQITAIAGDSVASAAPDGPAPSSNAPSKGDEDAVLDAEPAMGGYCPVTIRHKGLWVRGRYDDRVDVEDVVFYTAGPSEHDAFLADPAQYVPVLGGDCPVSFEDAGKRTRGSIYHAAQYQGRLYLMAGAEQKTAFKADPTRYANADLAANGDCVVTLAEENRRQPGFAEYAAWHAGRLYRFAGPEEKQKFLDAPDNYEEPSGEAPSTEPPPQPAVAQ